jgi:hypothetical protein
MIEHYAFILTDTYLSIIAVHGLGAYPGDWSWIRKVPDPSSGKVRHVNWLKDKDLLPSKIPHARIMAFNYVSRWHREAPKQRRSLCAELLLAALRDDRNKVISVKFILYYS